MARRAVFRLGAVRHDGAESGGISLGRGMIRWGKVLFFNMEFRMRKTTAAANGAVLGVGPVTTNGAEPDIDLCQPYTVRVAIKGTADLLFHRWNCDAVEEKAKAKKGSAAKKSDNVESYVYRNADGMICMPGEYLRMSIVNASKFRQDPRSPRKSAMDLYKAAVISLTPLALVLNNAQEPTHVDKWDYEHRCRVTIQRNGITRIRPAFLTGWRCTFDLLVNIPQYIDEGTLHEVIVDAGRLVGVGDFRPTYGRFQIVQFERII